MTILWFLFLGLKEQKTFTEKPPDVLKGVPCAIKRTIPKTKFLMRRKMGLMEDIK